MRKRQLEILLERLEGFSDPKVGREQYSTPAPVAAEIIYMAHLHGDLRVVCDLGCGTGILAIGSALMGARAVGVDIDPSALAAARRNAERLGVEVEFILADVGALELRGIDTVVMNPPFGAQRSSAGDRAFLRRATEMGRVIYSLHNAGSEGFIRRFVEPCRVQEVRRLRFPIRRTFGFHSRDVRTIEVELYRITCQ
ncbi:MAG: METTL5 family protein [Methanothrix sp.]|nr:METTL5 family protein [Methanothrix sp.]